MEHRRDTGSSHANNNARNGSQPPPPQQQQLPNRNNNTARWIAPMGGTALFPSTTSTTTVPASAKVSSILKGGRLSAQQLIQPVPPTFTATTTTSSSSVISTTTGTIPTTIIPSTTTSTAANVSTAAVAHQNNTENPLHYHHHLRPPPGPNHTSSASSNEPFSMMEGSATGAAVGMEKQPITKQQNSQMATARAQFCQFDVLACINCRLDTTTANHHHHHHHHYHNRSDITGTAEAPPPTTTSMNRKLGPLLLDLRRLEFTPVATNRNDDDNDEDETTTTTPSLFSTTVLAQSRGNPSLGSSMYSTCLSVPSHPQTDREPPASSSPQLPPLIATGLSTGALCIHSFTVSSSSPSDDGDGSARTTVLGPTAATTTTTSTSTTTMAYQSSIEYYQLPRNNRPATAVAWRPNHVSHVAIGYATSSATGGIPTTTTNSMMTNSFGFASTNNASPQEPTLAPHRRNLLQPGGVATIGIAGGAAGGGGLSSNPSTVVDRQYGCFLWDVEHQIPSTYIDEATSSPPIRRTKTTPLYKLSHNQGVLCLSWILDEAGGQILAIGGQQRNIQLYDLRISGSTSTPAVQPSPISAFGHSSGVHGIESDPTRPWHFCTFSSTVGEVVKIWDVRSIDSPLSEIKPIGTKNSTSTITAAKWSSLSPGHLSILVGESTLSTYDTISTASRPILMSTVRASKAVTSFTQYPFSNIDTGTGSHDDSASIVTDHKKRMMMELFPRQVVAVGSDHSVNVVSCHRIAPIAVSPRNGQIVHSIGRTLLLGSAAEGPAAMEGSERQLQDDISAIILRRAKGSATGKYSMDIASNIEILTKELLDCNGTSSASEQLIRLWKWVQIASGFCLEDTPNWPAKSLIDAGVTKLLELDKGNQDSQSFSDSLGCLTFDSQGRQAALASCGWFGKGKMSDLGSVMTDCESVGEYERSAALAIWHGNIGLAVDALERGAAFYASTGSNKDSHSTAYSETLEHIALSIAGYQVGDLKNLSVSVWRRSCTKLLQRPALSDPKLTGGTGYLRHIITFLLSIGVDDGHKAVLVDSALSLSDRVAFACRFLAQDDMITFVNNCIHECQSTGNLEGLTVTGLGTQGINILQSYVDITADIQTAALVTSRVVYPQDWPGERRTVDEWLYTYRTLLNTWQMWQVRAIFDVDRASVQRVAKLRLHQSGVSSATRSRPIPAQLDARCNYCSAPLGLRRQDNPPNQWLSKMKNVLPCCPRCRKPLPRCSICMLSLGVPNPYYELTKDRPRTSAPGTDDLSTLANLPFAEWFSWCLRCKHGGHAHHLVGWFAKHEVCPVSGCSCRCQFDGIRELQRPSLSTPPVTPNYESIENEKK